MWDIRIQQSVSSSDLVVTPMFDEGILEPAGKRQAQLIIPRGSAWWVAVRERHQSFETLIASLQMGRGVRGDGQGGGVRTLDPTAIFLSPAMESISLCEVLQLQVVFEYAVRKFGVPYCRSCSGLSIRTSLAPDGAKFPEADVVALAYVGNVTDESSSFQIHREALHLGSDRFISGSRWTTADLEAGQWPNNAEGVIARTWPRDRLPSEEEVAEVLATLVTNDEGQQNTALRLIWCGLYRDGRCMQGSPTVASLYCPTCETSFDLERATWRLGNASTEGDSLQALDEALKREESGSSPALPRADRAAVAALCDAAAALDLNKRSLMTTVAELRDSERVCLGLLVTLQAQTADLLCTIDNVRPLIGARSNDYVQAFARRASRWGVTTLAIVGAEACADDTFTTPMDAHVKGEASWGSFAPRTWSTRLVNRTPTIILPKSLRVERDDVRVREVLTLWLEVAKELASDPFARRKRVSVKQFIAPHGVYACAECEGCEVYDRAQCPACEGSGFGRELLSMTLEGIPLGALQKLTLGAVSEVLWRVPGIAQVRGLFEVAKLDGVALDEPWNSLPQTLRERLLLVEGAHRLLVRSHRAQRSMRVVVPYLGRFHVGHADRATLMALQAAIAKEGISVLHSSFP